MKTPHHESSHMQVSGEAVYIDDMQFSDRLLHAAVYYSPVAHGKITSYNLTKAEQLSGVHTVLTFKDIPGANQMGAIVHDEPVLAKNELQFIGQAVFLVAADTFDIAQAAVKLIEMEYEELEAVLTIEDAIQKNNKLHPTRVMACGNTKAALKKASHIIKDELHVGGQEHWYLETQICVSVPIEDGNIKLYSSTQNTSEVQTIIAEVLGLNKMQVEVETRRLGGAFGGKETQANHVAAWSALLAAKTKRPVKLRLFRDDDQIMTGKRHPYLLKYKAGFSETGILSAIDVQLHANAGSSTDLSMAILERAMLHAENSYYVPNMRIRATAWKTNLPSNTAYRGFGGPQGMMGIENILDQIARRLKTDAANIRYKNFYGIADRNTTPYGEIVENNRLYMLWEKLLKSSEYFERRKEIDGFNAKHEFRKRGIALTPVKFGISFTATFLNQAGALVNVYTDGTMLVNHGGIEMGQGLYTKMQQIAAAEMGISLDKVKVNATNTSKVPNSSPTAASSGADLNGMAVKKATRKIRKRIAKLVLNEFNKRYKGDASQLKNIRFKDNKIVDRKHNEREIPFAEAAALAHFNQISLSATGFYKTPDIFYSRETESGRPFHYYSFGMAVSEVELDTLTAEVNVIRTDILHDVGKSLNKGIDIGQVEGGFIQGMGWLTGEELKWDKKGNLLTHSPDTYKIPTIGDIPADFRVNLLKDAPNPNTIRRSKAVGEPPFMLAFSVWFAIKDAISAIAKHQKEPQLPVPATNEAILLAIEKLMT